MKLRNVNHLISKVLEPQSQLKICHTLRKNLYLGTFSYKINTPAYVCLLEISLFKRWQINFDTLP